MTVFCMPHQITFTICFQRNHVFSLPKLYPKLTSNSFTLQCLITCFQRFIKPIQNHLNEYTKGYLFGTLAEQEKRSDLVVAFSNLVVLKSNKNCQIKHI